LANILHFAVNLLFLILELQKHLHGFCHWNDYAERTGNLFFDLPEQWD